MLTIQHHGRVASVTLNRPEKLNALSGELRARLVTAFESLDADDEVAVIVMTGAGRAFCAGLDLQELAQSGDPRGADPVEAIARTRKPVIAAVNGPAITGGFELALAADILIASPDAVFADTHARIGILPGWRLSQKLSRTVGLSRAKELAFSGNYLDAQRAYEWGLVNRVCAPDRLLTEAFALAHDIAAAPAAHVRRYKQLIDVGYGMAFQSGVALEALVWDVSADGGAGSRVEDVVDAVKTRGRRQQAHRSVATKSE